MKPLHQPFGPLQGIKILSTGSTIAQPFAAALAAQMGAEVIQIEPPKCGDQAWRHVGPMLETGDGNEVGASWVQERRNTLHASLDLARPEGKAVFLDLIARSDIWMESSKPGTYDRWGLSDEYVLKRNKKIVVVHVSGFGQDGHPDYSGAPSYDMVAQAFSGMMHQTGFPDPAPPIRAAPWTGDYITALFCLWSSLAGYIHAHRTEQGQVIDLTQFEAIHQLLGGTMVEYFALGHRRERTGNKSSVFQPYDAFQARDGWIVIGAVSQVVFKRVCKMIDINPEDPKWIKAHHAVEEPEGRAFDAYFRAWVKQYSVADVQQECMKAKVPCSPILDSAQIAHHPHYKARQMHIEWYDVQLEKTVKGIGVCPKFSETPGKIWRGSVPVGHDNRYIYEEILGYGPDKLEALKRANVI